MGSAGGPVGWEGWASWTVLQRGAGPAGRGVSCGEGRVLQRGAGPAEGVGSAGRGGSCRGR